MNNSNLALPLHLSYFPHQVADLIAIKFGDRSNSVDIPHEVFRNAEERFVRCLTIAAPQKMAVRRDCHLDQPGSGSIFSEKAAEDCLEVVADLDTLEFPGAVLPNLVEFTDRCVVGH